MNEFLFHAHSGLRYLVLLAGLAAALYAAFGLMRRQAMDRTARVLTAAFVGLLDLQVVLGVVLLLVWQFYPQLIGHITMMVLAAGVAHATSVLARRRAADGNGLAWIVGGVVLTLVLIVGGIMAIERSVV